MKVSIIMPTHNDEKFVKDTITSVLNQTFDDYELIIIDDKSTDKTVDLIKSFADKRIKLIVNETNRGAAFSRNVGLRTASGEYVAFLDGDDRWYPEKLKLQLEFMERNGYLFSYTDYELIDEENNKLGIYYTGPAKVSYRKFIRIDYVGTSTVMYKRSIYPDLQIPDNILKRNDDALWFLLSKKADCYRFEGIYSQYRKNSNSISSGKKSKLYKYHVELYQKLYGFCLLKAHLFSLRNIFYYFLKQLRYKKKFN